MTTATAPRMVALAAALALPLALLSATSASAATVGVATWAELQAAFLVDGDTVRLDANITASASQQLVVEAGESITLDLNGFTLSISNPGADNAAISVPATASLTINDTTGGGTITATGGNYAAGIGGGDSGNGGTITINGGTTTATGGNYAAGIGGGDSGNGGTTTINGGTTTATGGDGGAGIGGGDNGNGGTTTINGGTLTATGGDDDGAGIGGGIAADGGTTTINGGTTTATGGNFGAGIGGGFGGDGGTTNINGGTTGATGGNYGAGIGGGYGGDGGTTNITGGIVEASGGLRAAGIGGGGQSGGIGGNGGTVSLSGGTIAATGGANAAGIGAGFGTFSTGAVGILAVSGTGDIGAAIDGGQPLASPITNPTTPAGVGYTATTSTISGGGRIELRFNYLITFSTNGGSSTASQTINEGDTLTTPATPTREGFEFAGWTSGGSAYDFATPITAPLTLSATWTAVLAATGTDVTTTLGVGALLIASGVILIALRRRAARQSA